MTTMAETSATFFEELDGRAREPLLERTVGSIRFDLAHGERTEHWRVDITDGDLSVSRDDAAADCIVRADRATFDEVVTGELNLMVAVLRDLLVPEGDVELLVRFQRILPAPTRRPAEDSARTLGRQRA